MLGPAGRRRQPPSASGGPGNAAGESPGREAGTGRAVKTATAHAGTPGSGQLGLLTWLLLTGTLGGRWAPVTHAGELRWAPSSWLQPCPASVTEGIWGAGQQIGVFRLSLPPFWLRKAGG